MLIMKNLDIDFKILQNIRLLIPFFITCTIIQSSKSNPKHLSKKMKMYNYNKILV